MNNKELVSVCIPVYNGEKFISQTLDSITNQTYKNIEIIVSDNASTDNTCNIVEEYKKKDNRIKLNKNKKNLGYSGNLNKLIELANSEYIAIYHADDVYEPTIVEEEMKFLKRNNELAGCFTLGKKINEKGEIFEPSKERYQIKENIKVDLDLFLKKITRYRNIFVCPTAIIKKDVYLELGGYRDIKYIEDQDMWIRILEKYRLGIIGKQLIKYRIHSGQESKYYSDLNRTELPVNLKYLKKYLKAKCKYKRKYQPFLDKRIAKSYLILARNRLLLDDYEGYIENICKSKEVYVFRFRDIKGYLLQNSHNAFCYYLIRILVKIIGH